MSQEIEQNTTKTIPLPLAADRVAWPDIRTQSQLQTAAETLQQGGRIYPEQGSKIGEILKSLEVIDEKILDAVEKRHQTKKANDKPTGELLVYMGIIETEVLTRALCMQSGVIMVDVESINIPLSVLKFVSSDNAKEKRVIPVCVHNGTLYLAVSDPFGFSDQHFFAFSSGLKIKPVFATEKQISIGLNAKWTDENSEIWAG